MISLHIEDIKISFSSFESLKPLVSIISIPDLFENFVVSVVNESSMNSFFPNNLFPNLLFPTPLEPNINKLKAFLYLIYILR